MWAPPPHFCFLLEKWSAILTVADALFFMFGQANQKFKPLSCLELLTKLIGCLSLVFRTRLEKDAMELFPEALMYRYLEWSASNVVVSIIGCQPLTIMIILLYCICFANTKSLHKWSYFGLCQSYNVKTRSCGSHNSRFWCLWLIPSHFVG